ncbi:MAG: electron transport complex subunit RsxC [Panacagrimonas sp.]
MSTATRRQRFFGGLKLEDHKPPGQQAFQVADIPDELILPLSQHSGAPSLPLVKPGDRVLRGQTIAGAQGALSLPLHAPSSGTVSAIEPRPVAHPSGLTAECIVIQTDGQDEALANPEWPATTAFQNLSAETIVQRLQLAGIAGLGGAVFPSFFKLRGQAPIHTLVLNGAECEPYIRCDDVLMQTRAEDVLRGAQILLQASGAEHCLIGVEDNKTEAISALRTAAQMLQIPARVIAVPTRYPQGGSNQLIQTLTGSEVPSEGLPLDIGIVSFNVATAAAVWDAIALARPLISRLVTVAGEGISAPQTFEVRLGTPFASLIAQAGGIKDTAADLIMGGPMMGFKVSHAQVPIIKASNCVLVRPTKPNEPARACIRCGECAQVCPARLLPQQLYWHARSRNFERAEAYNLFDCIECGCCAQVCPSHIPLVQYYRNAKSELRAQATERSKSEFARQRHEARQLRLQAEKQAREEARRRKKLAMQAAAKKQQAEADPVAAALARAQAKQGSENQSS